jgi:3-dehydroquinate synthase
MWMAADLSHRLGWLSAGDLARTETLLRRANLPVRAPEDMSPERFIELMSLDKKVLDGRIRLVLLKQLGEAVVTDSADPDLLRETLLSN